MPKDAKTPQPSAAEMEAAKEITICAKMSVQRRQSRTGSAGKTT